MLARLRELEGALVFTIVTVGLTLACALWLVPPVDAAATSWSAMLRASVLYIAVVGWQPLIGFTLARRFATDRLRFDEGFRVSATRHSLAAVGIGLFVVTVSVLLGSADPLPDPQQLDGSWLTTARVVLAFLGVISLLWLQAIIEELGWRSYVLPRLMLALGPWPGLLVHGVLWGLCYSPWFAVAGGSLTRSLGYVVTCCLFGVVLGWLRLSTRSIFASAATNATLTICAGLPLLLTGESTRFSAAFEPPGWVPLAVLAIAIVLHRPWRRAIAIPWQPVLPRAR